MGGDLLAICISPFGGPENSDSVAARVQVEEQKKKGHPAGEAAERRRGVKIVRMLCTIPSWQLGSWR